MQENTKTLERKCKVLLEVFKTFITKFLEEKKQKNKDLYLNIGQLPRYLVIVSEATLQLGMSVISYVSKLKGFWLTGFQDCLCLLVINFYFFLQAASFLKKFKICFDVIIIYMNTKPLS